MEDGYFFERFLQNKTIALAQFLEISGNIKPAERFSINTKDLIIN